MNNSHSSVLRLVQTLPSWIFVALSPLLLVLPVFASEPTPEAHLTIPALNLDAPIVTIPLDSSIGTWNTAGLGENVGHFEYTPWLDQVGNIVLGGHYVDAQGDPSIFYDLGQVAAGDTLVVSQGAVSHEYRVTLIRQVPTNDISVLNPSNRDTVTLITCTDYDSETQSFMQRLVITAERIR